MERNVATPTPTPRGAPDKYRFDSQSTLNHQDLVIPMKIRLEM